MARSAKSTGRRTRSRSGDEAEQPAPPPEAETEAETSAEPEAVIPETTAPAAPPLAEDGGSDAPLVLTDPQAADTPTQADPVPPDTPEDVDAAPTEVVAEAPSAAPQPPPEEPRAPEPPPAAPTPPPAPRRPSFVPMVLGGVIAAGLGYAAAVSQLVPVPGAPQTGPAIAALDEARKADEARLSAVEAQQATLDRTSADLSQRIAALSDDLAGLPPAASPDDLLAEVDSRLSDLSSRLDALGARLDTLEGRPPVEAKLSPEAEQAIQDQVAAIRAEMQGGLARIEDERKAADERLAAADAAALAARRSAAVASVRAALDAGAPYAAQLSDLVGLTGAEAPPALADPAETGVPSLLSLQSAFPDAARAALDASVRAAADQGEVGGLTALLRTQLGMRSLTPKEGDDPDAVLSRAEAALAGGDVGAALDLVSALPDAGKAAMADWVAEAQRRRDAVAALDGLAGT